MMIKKKQDKRIKKNKSMMTSTEVNRGCERSDSDVE